LFVVGYLSRFMEDHWVAVKRLLRYVKGMTNQGVVFPKTSGIGLRLKCFSDADADMADDVDRRKSTSGMLVFLYSSPIA